MDDLAFATRPVDHFSTILKQHIAVPSFQPRFDVREQDGIYELKGELPGLDSQQIEILFTDSQTLVVRSRTDQSSSPDAPVQTPYTATPESAIEAAKAEPEVTSTLTNPAPLDQSATTTAPDDDAVSTHSASYQKATVEDEDSAIKQDSVASSTNGSATPTESIVDEAPTQVKSPAAPFGQTQPGPQYWLAERSFDSFQRAFQFSNRIDHDGVKASLKNGILSITVPKARSAGVRKISIE